MVGVELGRKVEYEVLEKALLEAAHEMGMRASVRDITRMDYQLGSVREVQEYVRTDISLRGRVLPQMQVSVDKRDSPKISYFFIDGVPFGGFASPKKVKRYLDAVSKNLG